ncbi:MAG: glutamine--tRNA ligase/YqeY domain fusion protein [Planctomycetes bacterium]|nr:glutamine--tRNA ligase/YqeY domain fusion protein [Planctomycetota bacterium]
MNDRSDTNAVPPVALHFIDERVQADLAAGRYGGRVHTRFPPEPNGYLHIGHAKSICLNFGLAQRFGGLCNLRFDDTNPTTEEVEYVESIQRDVRWLGFEWGERLYYASDFFERIYGFAEELVRHGKAYVCDLGPDDMSRYRGSLTAPGTDSPYRARSVAENLDLLERMRRGEFPEGSRTLRAKIDMASPNMNLRDPVLYRILKAAHHRTGTAWSIYPTYDYAHPLCDALESITHSICTLEFENHRPLYDWVRDNCSVPARPEQIEFARLNVTYMVLSKRKLLRLVNERRVLGWDDPRMPTISGLRRRGYTAEALRTFCERIGVARFTSTVDIVQLENALRDDLNKRAPRAMAVLRPLEVLIENYPSDTVEELTARNNPEDPAAGERKVKFSKRLFIERDDFREDPPKDFYRLGPGREVRLRYAYYVKCTGFDKDPATGEVTRVHCTYDPATRGGDSPDGRKVKGTIHWVSAEHAQRAEVRLYDHLFGTEFPEEVGEGQDFMVNLNPKSLEVVRDAALEAMLIDAEPGSRWQFERHGYFCVDVVDSRPGAPVFNRAVSLKDSWAKLEKKQHAKGAERTR